MLSREQERGYLDAALGSVFDKASEVSNQPSLASFNHISLWVRNMEMVLQSGYVRLDCLHWGLLPSRPPAKNTSLIL